jgi:hypothetical protein
MAFLRRAHPLHGKSLSAVLMLGHTDKICPQSDVLYPESHAQLWKSLGRDFDDDDAFRTRVVAWLGQAVRIPYVFLLNALCLYSAAFRSLRLP